MASSKLSPEQWAKVRAKWQADPREGYLWLVTELALPVSPPAVRKRAVAEGWAKAGETNTTPATARGGKTGLVSRTRETKICETRETRETNNRTELTPFKTRETPCLDELDQDQPQQGLFVREYIKDLNGTQAAIRAGYSIATARSQASDLLTNPNIQAAIQAGYSPKCSDVTASRLLGNVKVRAAVLSNGNDADPARAGGLPQ